MPNKTLTWFVGGYPQVTPHDGAERFGAGQVHVLDAHYKPKLLRIRSTGAPKSGSLVLDIKDDGDTIFSGGYPQLDRNTTSKDHDVFSPVRDVRMEKDSIIALSINTTASEVRNLTVELDMEEVE